MNNIDYQYAPKEDEILCSQSVEKLVRHMNEMNSHLKALKREYEDNKKQLAEYMGASTYLMNYQGQQLAKYSIITSRRFDSKRFKADHTDLYMAYQKEILTDRLDLK